MRYYCDSNVVISLVKSEIGKGYRLMYPAVDHLLKNMKQEGHIALISKFCITEIMFNTPLSEEDIFQFFKGIKVEKLAPNEKAAKLAVRIYAEKGIHIQDARHIALASFYSADLVVTWNKKDFIDAEDIVPSSSPDELI